MNADIKCESFEWVINSVGEKDFVYFDPPYYPVNENSFTNYTRDVFLEKEHSKLLKICNGVHNSGAFFMLSNSNTDFVRNLYRNYNIETVEAPRFINSDGEGRGKVEEILVTNYDFKKVKNWWE
jgi:DNA adenine methylase